MFLVIHSLVMLSKGFQNIINLFQHFSLLEKLKNISNFNPPKSGQGPDSFSVFCSILSDPRQSQKYLNLDSNLSANFPIWDWLNNLWRQNDPNVSNSSLFNFMYSKYLSCVRLKFLKYDFEIVLICFLFIWK